MKSEHLPQIVMGMKIDEFRAKTIVGRMSKMQ